MTSIRTYINLHACYGQYIQFVHKYTHKQARVPSNIHTCTHTRTVAACVAVSAGAGRPPAKAPRALGTTSPALPAPERQQTLILLLSALDFPESLKNGNITHAAGRKKTSCVRDGRTGAKDTEKTGRAKTCAQAHTFPHGAGGRRRGARTRTTIAAAGARKTRRARGTARRP